MHSVRRVAFWALATVLALLTTIHNDYAQDPTTVPGSTSGPSLVHSGQSTPGTVPAYPDEGTAILRNNHFIPSQSSQTPLTSATSLTITATFDPSLTAPEIAVINSAISLYQNTFKNPINVTIYFTFISTGLGQSTTTVYPLSYLTFITALRANATSADDVLALSGGRLPISATNPLSRTTTINVKTANIRALGIAGSFPPTGGYDGVIGLNTLIMDTNGGMFSMFATVEHEIDEVLGLGSAIPSFSDPLPEDLFRYASAANARSFSANPSCVGPPQAFFSIDGTTDLDEFHNCSDGNDYGDWITHTPSQIQDAITNGTGSPPLNTCSPEARALDVVGYDITNPGPTLISLTPSRATPGAAAFALMVTGANFDCDSSVQWNGAARTTTFVSSTSLTATILASDIASDGTAQVTVFNPGPGGGTSNALTFTINYAGPTGGDVRALAIDPSDPATLYAGTYGHGVFKSTNGGMSWVAANSGLPIGTTVNTLAINPSNPPTLYAGAGDAAATVVGVFKSTNGGTSWTAISSGLPTTNLGLVYALAIDPSTPTTLYAGTNGSGVFKSTNGGTSWTVANSGLTCGATVLAIDPSTPATLYAGGGGVCKSTDGGSSWTAVNSGLSNRAIVQALAIDPSTPAILYAGTFNSGGLFKSTNGGTSWTAFNSGLTDSNLYALAIDPSSPTTLYAWGLNNTFNGGGLFKSTNGGTSWTAIGSGLTESYVYALAIDPSTPATLYAGGYGGGVSKSTNGGTSWTAVNSGLTATSVYALAIDPSTPATLYAGTDGVVFKSTDGGTSWTGSPGIGSSVYSLAIDPSTPATLYAGTSVGVYKSIDGGASWSNTGGGGYPLAIDPSNPATIYAGSFKSTDGGTNWTTTRCGGYSLAIDPSNPATIYYGGSGVYKSTDGGTSCTPASPTLANKLIGALAIDPSTPGTVYAGADDGLVYVGTNGGTSWPGNPGPGPFGPVVKTLAIAPSTPLYAGTYGGGVFGGNAGNSGLTNLFVTALAIDPSDHATLYAGTLGGVFKSTNGGMTWQPTGANMNMASAFKKRRGQLTSQ